MGRPGLALTSSKQLTDHPSPGCAFGLNKQQQEPSPNSRAGLLLPDMSTHEAVSTHPARTDMKAGVRHEH